MNRSDNAVLQRAHQMDAAALAWIYDEFSPAIFAYAYRLTGDSYLAEECVSETFSRLLQALRAGGGPQDHLKAYLYRIAHNWVTDQYRRAAPAAESLEEENESGSNDEPSTQKRIEEREQKVEIRNALRVLTADQRLVITLRFLEDQTIEQVALALQKPVGAVKALQHRALQTLKKTLPKPDKG
ncbi:MAG: sigma-70 family RNA polymerase sigma factor [Chloroflexi bacterium]|nr:sigma-70 family RNA polymerase sigma factor [Chloroflexota bacterium]